MNRYHLSKTQRNLWLSIPTVVCFNTTDYLSEYYQLLFKKVMESILSGIPNVVVYIDEILVTGPNEDTHLEGRDRLLSRVLCYVQYGWPIQSDEDVKPYWTRKLELSTEAGCLVWCGRVVVPPQGRECVVTLVF